MNSTADSDDFDGLPTHIGKYELKSVLGRGGMGRVLRGFDPVLRRDVAIKLVEPDAVDPESLAELRFMFHREARAYAALRHPSVMEVFDYSGPDAALPFIACELIDGPTLREILDVRAALPRALAASLAYELAGALAHAHEAGIVHRDLKPENIFWTSRGRIVLGDFGIAKAFDSSARLGLTVQFDGTNIYGSPAYIAPEQLAGTAVGPQTDLYALGTVLYECLSGMPVIVGPTVDALLDAVSQGMHQPIRELVDISPGFSDLVEALLSVDPAHRPKTADWVVGDLRAVLDELKVSDPRLHLRQGGAEVTRAAIAYRPGAAADPPPAAQVAEVEPTVLFAQQELPEAIRVELRSRPQSRFPVFIGMIALAIALGLATHLMRKVLQQDQVAAVVVEDQCLSLDPENLVAGALCQSVMVELRLLPDTTVVVDDRVIGTWSGVKHLGLPPGAHTLKFVAAGKSSTKEVHLMGGTTPVFSLMPQEPL